MAVVLCHPNHIMFSRKKFLAGVLAACLAFSTAVPAFATEITEPTEDTPAESVIAENTGVDSVDAGVDQTDDITVDTSESIGSVDSDQIEDPSIISVETVTDITEESIITETITEEEDMVLPEIYNREVVGTTWTVDENGNLIPMEVLDGTFTESDMMCAAFSISGITDSVQVVNFNTGGSGVKYYTEVGTGKQGYVVGTHGADAIYLGTNGSKVRFMMSGVIGEIESSLVQVITTAVAKNLSYYTVVNGNLRHYVCTNMVSDDSTFRALNQGKAPSYLANGVKYYSYDGHYFYTAANFQYMASDYNNMNRSHSVNPSSPYYNYFQYLPARSTTSYSASELSSIINSKISSAKLSTSKMTNIGPYLINAQNKYGVNALLMAGIAANESAYGTSSIAMAKNNIFGLSAYDGSAMASANQFASNEECINIFASKWLSLGYLNPSNFRYNGGFLGNKGSGFNVSYASDPYWGEVGASVQYAFDAAGGNKDAYKYTIAVKDTIAGKHTSSLNVRASASSSAATPYKASACSNVTVLVLDKGAKTNNFYRIQSDAVLNSSGSALDMTTGVYNFQNMYAYISADYFTLVNNGTASNPVTPSTPSSPTGKTGFVNEGGTVWYYRNGVKDTNYSDIIYANYNGTTAWWCITGGKLNTAETVAHNANGWFYCNKGKVDFSYNGLATNQNGTWYCQDGKVYFNVSGVIYTKKSGVYGWWNLVDSKVIPGPTVAHNQNGWWYIDETGKVDFNANTVAHNANGWWGVTNGKVTFSFNGFLSNANGTWYCKDSRVDFSITSVVNGFVNGEEGWWNVVDNKLTPGPTVAYNQNGWWYCDNRGKVDFSYNGFAKNHNGWWYISNGKVDFNKNGTVKGTVNGKSGSWRVVNGKVML